MYISKWRSLPEKATDSVIPTVCILEKATLRRRVELSVVARDGRGGMKRQVTEDFQGSENTL